LDGRAATAALAATAELPPMARGSSCASGGEALAATAALLADARHSLDNARKNEAMRTLTLGAGTQWAAAMALGFVFVVWSRHAARPALGIAAALAAWAAAAWAARVPWPRRRGVADAAGAVRDRPRGDRDRRRGGRARARSGGATRGAAAGAELARRLRRLRRRDRNRLAAAGPLAHRPRRQPLSRALPPGPPLARHARAVGARLRPRAAGALVRMAALGQRRSDAAGEPARRQARRRRAPRRRDACRSGGVRRRPRQPPPADVG